jgi:hypothetical protein
MVYRGIALKIWIGRKLQLIVQLLQQVFENTELASGFGVQNAYIFMPGRNVCVSE